MAVKLSSWQRCVVGVIEFLYRYDNIPIVF